MVLAVWPKVSWLLLAFRANSRLTRCSEKLLRFFSFDNESHPLTRFCAIALRICRHVRCLRRAGPENANACFPDLRQLFATFSYVPCLKYFASRKSHYLRDFCINSLLSCLASVKQSKNQIGNEHYADSNDIGSI